MSLVKVWAIDMGFLCDFTFDRNLTICDSFRGPGIIGSAIWDDSSSVEGCEPSQVEESVSDAATAEFGKGVDVEVRGLGVGLGTDLGAGMGTGGWRGLGQEWEWS